MAWLDWSKEYPVIVVGVRDGQVTEDGNGYQEFPNHAAALAVFPDIVADVNGKRFTWAMNDSVGGSPRTRFETWKANDLLSS